MGLRGAITVECDQRKCQAEQHYSDRLDDTTLHQAMAEDGWTINEDGYACPQCSEDTTEQDEERKALRGATDEQLERF